jgi:hypothetical protein
MRFSPTDLRDKALLSLDEAYEEAQKGPIAKSAALKLTLAVLANHLEDDWGPKTFWKVATNPQQNDTESAAIARRQSLQNAYAFIYRGIGLDPAG